MTTSTLDPIEAATRLLSYEGEDAAWLSLRCQLESLAEKVQPLLLVGTDGTSQFHRPTPANDVLEDTDEHGAAPTTTRVVGGRKIRRPKGMHPDVLKAETLLSEWAGERAAEPATHADPWLLKLQRKYDRHNDWWLWPSEAGGVIERLG